ncbi:MAG: hypothetical protein EXQ55_01210 [Acidobacteria bacterium]|nr:hypothetical protein [Acidobacteriota bacterium]
MKIPITIVAFALMAMTTSAEAQPTPSERFDKARWHVEMAGNPVVVDVILEFQFAALMIIDKDSGDAMKSVIYFELAGGEYSFATSPGGKKAGSLPRLLRLTGGNRHWLVIRTPTDSTQLELDETNYKQALAALETKMRKKVTVISQ